jgi:hypothetical protein
MLALNEPQKEKPIKERYLQILRHGTISEVYNYLYSLSLEDLVALLGETKINFYTPFMIKRLVICDSQGKINKMHSRVSKLSK